MKDKACFFPPLCLPACAFVEVIGSLSCHCCCQESTGPDDMAQHLNKDTAARISWGRPVQFLRDTNKSYASRISFKTSGLFVAPGLL